MQSLTNGLKAAARRRTRLTLLKPHQIASTSRVQWDARRTAWNPIHWLRKSIAPQTREQDSEKDIQKARERLKESGQASVFETAQEESPTTVAEAPSRLSFYLKAKQPPTEHKYSTGVISISHRKLNLLARQVSGKPIDVAILQMEFSEKRVSKRIKNSLVVARNHAVEKGLGRDRLIVSEAWVNKGPGGRNAKRLEIKGRGKFGIRKKYKAKMHVVLREGLTIEEKKQKEREYKLNRIVSAGIVREDIPLRNPRSSWAW